MAGGRRGQRGLRLTRMDAAVDHLSQMGFPKVDIRKKVKELLEEYGGPDGWVFIEDSSYKLVIEQLLGDQGGSESDAPLLSDAASQENMHGDAVSSSASGLATVIPDVDMVQHLMDVEKNGGYQNQGSAVNSTDNVTNNEDDVFPPGVELTPLEAVHAQPPSSEPSLRCESNFSRRKPCYGWWGEETEIITLP